MLSKSTSLGHANRQTCIQTRTHAYIHTDVSIDPWTVALLTRVFAMLCQTRRNIILTRMLRAHAVRDILTPWNFLIMSRREETIADRESERYRQTDREKSTMKSEGQKERDKERDIRTSGRHIYIYPN